MSYTKPKYNLHSKENRQKLITNYQLILEEILASNGWLITKKTQFTEHFWFIEMWTLQSVWSPNHLQLFLVFEDDEMHYSVAITKIEPTEHHPTDWKARLYFKTGWEKNIPKFIETINLIRNESCC